MKIKGFFKDVGGASRVLEMRKEAIANASPVPVTDDPIFDLAKALHLGTMKLKVTEVRLASPTARTFRLVPEDRARLPVFQAGQYASLNFKIGETMTTRPYSISSAPFEARGDDPFIEITVRNAGDAFVADYMFKEIQPGSVLEANLPCGQFYYEPLRDAEKVVALAGGSGITPFYSMAREIAHGKLGFNLTILYGSRKSDDIIFKNELDALNCDKIKAVYVLSDEPYFPGETGFLTKELISKYSEGDTSYFICGPQAMYRFVAGELDALGISRRRIRNEVFGAPRNIAAYPGFPEEARGKTYKLTVMRGLQKDEIDASSEEPVAVALERAGIVIGTRCRSGECGYCRSRLLRGDVFVCPDGDGRRMMDREKGYFHPCSSYPLSDLAIKIPIA